MRLAVIVCIVLVATGFCAPLFGGLFHDIGSFLGGHKDKGAVDSYEDSPTTSEPNLEQDGEGLPQNGGQHDNAPPEEPPISDDPNLQVSRTLDEPTFMVPDIAETSTPSNVPWLTMPIAPGINPALNLPIAGPTLNGQPPNAAPTNSVTSAGSADTGSPTTPITTSPPLLDAVPTASQT